MTNQLYLCKIKQTNGKLKGDHALFFNQKPNDALKVYDKNMKHIAKYDKSISENIKYEILECKQKDFNTLTVCINVSYKIRTIRKKIEGLQYRYNSVARYDNFIHKYDNNIDKALLFGFDNNNFYADLFYLEKNYNKAFDKMAKEVLDFMNSKEDLIIKNICYGDCLYKTYFYDPKKYKYADIIELIKKDFKSYYDKNRFFYYELDKESMKNDFLHQPSGKKVKISLDQCSNQIYLYINSFELGTRDISWLNSKLEIKVEKDRIKDVSYIQELKKKHSNDNKKNVKTKYEDKSSYGHEYYNEQEKCFEINHDCTDIIMYSDDEKEELLKRSKILEEKYGPNVFDEYIEKNENKNNQASLNLNDEIIHNIFEYCPDSDNVFNIIFSEIIQRRDVPKYEYLMHMDIPDKIDLFNNGDDEDDEEEYNA